MTYGVITYSGSNGSGTPEIGEGATENITADSIMGVGSIGKMFTTAMALKLAEQRQLSLDDKVTDILNGNSAVEEAIGTLLSGDSEDATIADLLSHKSGVPNINADYVRDSEADVHGQWNIIDLVNGRDGTSYLQDPTEYGKTSYSNVGFMILGIVVEHLDHQTNHQARPYQEIIQEAIIAPLGLENTGYYEQIKNKNNLVTVELNGEDLTGISTAGAAGSLFSNVQDLETFITEFSRGINGGEAADQNKLFNRETLVRMNQSIQDISQEGQDFGIGYQDEFGLGFEGRKDADGTIVKVAHGGQTTGYLAYVRHNPATQDTDIVMVAADDVSGLDMGAKYGPETIDHYMATMDKARETPPVPPPEEAAAKSLAVSGQLSHLAAPDMPNEPPSELSFVDRVTTPSNNGPVISKK